MPANTTHIVEDEFHRLQAPSENDTVTDANLANIGQIAIWNYDRSLRGRVHASVASGHATLEGTVDTSTQRDDLEARIGATEGIAGVTNRIQIFPDGPKAFATERQAVHGEPMLYVTRYCSLDAASVSSAIQGGLAEIDAHLASLAIPRPEEVVLIYRNRLPETVTLDIGYPVSREVASSTTDAIRRASTPAGQMLSAVPGDGVRGLLETHDHLLDAARRANLVPADIVWQRFPLRSAHHAGDRSGIPVFLPVAVN